MRKVLMILGIVFLVLVVGFVALLFWGQQSGSAMQERFYKAVTSGDVDNLVTEMDPALAEKIDKPVLAAWMKNLHKVLGEYKGLSKTKFSTNVKTENGVKIAESTGTVLFANGEGTSELVYRNDKLVSFSLKTDIDTPPWWEDEGIVAMCKDRGEAFLKTFLTGTADETFGLMHEALQAEMPKDKLAAMMAGVRTKAGELQSITFDQHRWLEAKKAGATLEVFFRVKCATGDTLAMVQFKFKEMAAILLAFDFTAKPPTP